MTQRITSRGLERHLYKETKEEIILERKSGRVTGRLYGGYGPINSLGILSFGTPFTIFTDNINPDPFAFNPNMPLSQRSSISLKNGDKVYIAGRPYIVSGTRYG